MRHKKNNWRMLLLYCFCLLFILASVIIAAVVLSQSRSDPVTQGETYQPADVAADPVNQPNEDVSLPAFLTEPVTEPVTDPPAPPETDPPVYYDFASPVPETEKVKNDYFSDAVFIGDSRTVGLGNYAPSDIQSAFYAKVSLNISTALTTQFIDDKYTILEAIEKDPKFKKVYLWFGLNELGWPSTVTFINTYKYLITHIQDSMPDAEIYVISIVPVFKSVSDVGQYGVTNANVVRLNTAISEMCRDMNLFYVNAAEAFSDANGALPEYLNPSDTATKLSNDGKHLTKYGATLLFDYLSSHTVALPVVPLTEKPVK